MLLRFLGHMSGICQASTLRVYLAAIRALHIRLGCQEPLLTCSRIPLVIRGRRQQKRTTGQPQKHPLTALVLHTITLQLNVSKVDDVMLWAAYCTAFFGFLQAAEFTCAKDTFLPESTLAVSSVSIDTHPIPDAVFLRIKRSKTDQFARGCSVVLARFDGPICPVAALLA